jgi:hypothetical protein
VGGYEGRCCDGKGNGFSKDNEKSERGGKNEEYDALESLDRRIRELDALQNLQKNGTSHGSDSMALAMATGKVSSIDDLAVRVAEIQMGLGISLEGEVFIDESLPVKKPKA